MNTSGLRLTPFLIAFALIRSNAATAGEPYTLLHSFFDPGTSGRAEVGQGTSVAVDGNIAVTGIPHDFASGVAKVYDATTGALLHTLTNPMPAFFDRFGRSVAISGTRIVVGAISDDTGADEAGSAYVYDLASATPTVPVLTLNNPDPAVNDHFGAAVAISGARIVVGATEDNNGGSAYVYDLASTPPTVPVVTLTNPSPAFYESFGSSVAVSRTRVVVGAPFNSIGGRSTGSAYVYDLNSATLAVPVVTLNNPGPEEFEYFGTSVAISGTRVVVGAPDDNTGALHAGNSYVYDLARATPAVPVATLNNPSPGVQDNFGNAVAISGTRILIGTFLDDTGAPDAGTAYVYDLARPTPTVPVATLNNPSPAREDRFAWSLAISDTRVVIAAIWDDTVTVNAGIAYAYDLASPAPTMPAAELNHPIPASALFGSAVALSGTRVVVGAPWDNTGAQFAGQAYVHDFASATPTTPVATLINPSPNAFDYFGSAVAIAGTRAIVGAHRGGDIAGYNAGVVYVYDLAGATPATPAITLTNPTTGGRGGFGVSLAVSGARLVIGEYRSDISSVDPGRAYVYDFASATPTAPILTLTNPSTMGHGGFGSAVAISGTRVLVGVPQSAAGALLSGSAYVYDLTSATPARPVVTLTNPTPALEDYFGSSVAISGTRAVVGAARDDIGTTDSGAAYVYDLAGGTPGAPLLTLTNPSPAALDNFATSVAISGTRVVIGAHQDDTSAEDAGVAYVYDLASTTPAVPVTMLTKPTPIAGDGFGQSVGIDGMTIVAGAPYVDTTAANRGAAYVFGVAMTLSIVPAAPGWATVSWTPATLSGFVLQYTDGFASSNWMATPSGAANPVTIPLTNAARFYRLAQP